MPCFINVGANVGEGTMIDTWATVGSCAQIGSNVHISGGTGIGGVLEPLQAGPVIIEITGLEAVIRLLDADSATISANAVGLPPAASARFTAIGTITMVAPTWLITSENAVVSSASVTTSGPATLVAFWWGDASGLVHSAIPNNGFSIIENFVNLPPNSAVQCVVAVRQVAGAGTYNVSWTQTPSQGAVLWLMAFQSDDAIFESGFE